MAVTYHLPPLEPAWFYLKDLHEPLERLSLCNSITPLLIVLESCSNPRKMLQVLESAIKNICGFGFCFFVSDVINRVGFWPFWLKLPVPRPNR